MPQKADNNKGQQSTAKQSKPPVFKTKAGRVHLAAFEQAASSGDTFLSITLKRVYKTDSGEFRDAYSFAISDLDDVARCLQDVKTWAAEHRS